MSVGAGVASALLRGLAWFLLGLAALLLLLTALRVSGLQAIEPSMTDIGGAALCAGLGIICRLLAAKFEKIG